MPYLTCDECRAQMCTDSLLNELRCADCRHIQSEKTRAFVGKLSLVLFGGLLGYLLARSRRAVLASENDAGHTPAREIRLSSKSNSLPEVDDADQSRSASHSPAA
jgi:hypothetical protein